MSSQNANRASDCVCVNVVSSAAALWECVGQLNGGAMYMVTWSDWGACACANEKSLISAKNVKEDGRREICE